MTCMLSQISAQLRKMESSAAADWLIENYPIEHPRYWEVFQIIPHVSWKRPEQARLAKYYLRKRPFASASPYAVFASIMSFTRFLKAMREVIPDAPNDREMLLYLLRPVLEESAKTNRDKELAELLINDLT